MEKTDTLKLFTNRPRVPKKKKKLDEKELAAAAADSIAALSIAIKAVTPTSHEIYDPVKISFDTP